MASMHLAKYLPIFVQKRMKMDGVSETSQELLYLDSYSCMQYTFNCIQKTIGNILL